MAIYTVRSAHQFCEQLSCNFVFRYFLDLGLDERDFDASTCAKNQQRRLQADVAGAFSRA